MMRELSQHAFVNRSLSFVATFGLVAFGAGLAPDEVEAIETIEDPYVIGGASPVPVQEEPVDPGTLIQYSPSELEDMVGRIALYPDDLIAIVLPASTFPLQVVEAQRFLERSKQGGSTTPDPEWDQSVVALLNYPDVVSLMNEDLEWMSRLGDAVVNQQQDVLAAVSRFRDRAYAAGNLRSDDRQVVSRPEEVIEIAPADPEVIYVPYYEPARVIVYEPAPVFYYYPRPCPVYYYSYPPNYFYAGYRPFWPFHFWGVSFVFNIGWHEHHLHVHDHGHWRPPYFGHHYYAWNRHDHRHWRDDRRWHHDDDRHDGWHDHEGDDWRDRNGDDDRGNHQQFAGSGRKGQGKSIVAKDGIELAAAADTGKGRIAAAKPAGSAKPATSGRPATPTKSGKPVSAAKPHSASQPAKEVASSKPAASGKSGAAKPVSPAKPGATKVSSGAQLADSTSRGRSGDTAERAASGNGQDKRSPLRPPAQKPVHGTTQLASNETAFAPRSSGADRADTRPRPGTPPPRTTAQSQRPAPTTQYVNGFASQPQPRSSTSSQRSEPAAQYMNGFTSQPRSTQTWSTARPEARTSSREYSTQRSDQAQRASAPARSAEASYSAPPQASRSSPPPQTSRSQQASRSSPPPQASRSAPSTKSAPAKGDSGGSGKGSSGSSQSSRGGGDGNASRN
jgi:hypothetical protein